MLAATLTQSPSLRLPNLHTIINPASLTRMHSKGTLSKEVSRHHRARLLPSMAFSNLRIMLPRTRPQERTYMMPNMRGMLQSLVVIAWASHQLHQDHLPTMLHQPLRLLN